MEQKRFVPWMTIIAGILVLLGMGCFFITVHYYPWHPLMPKLFTVALVQMILVIIAAGSADYLRLKVFNLPSVKERGEEQ